MQFSIQQEKGDTYQSFFKSIDLKNFEHHYLVSSSYWQKKPKAVLRKEKKIFPIVFVTVSCIHQENMLVYSIYSLFVMLKLTKFITYENKHQYWWVLLKLAFQINDDYDDDVTKLDM